MTIEEKRQGDVLLVRVNGLPNGAPNREEVPVGGRLILAEGEVTGHHHAVVAETLPAIKWFGQHRMLIADAPFEVVHEEHSRHAFEPGVYEVLGQYEFDEKEQRAVLD